MKKKLMRMALIVGLIVGLTLLGYRGDVASKKSLPVWKQSDGGETARVMPAQETQTTEQQIQEGERDTGTETESTDGQTAEQTSKVTEDGRDYAQVVEQILADGSKEFFRGYPVDEAFVCWVGGTYGTDTLELLAKKLASGSTDDELWYQLTGNTMHVLWLDYCKAHGVGLDEQMDVVRKEAREDSTITLDFIGDINFADDWCTMEAAETAGGVDACISPEVQTELQDADFTVVNNEFTYTDRGHATEGKSYVFRAKPEHVKQLAVFGTDLVSLANNHTYDYGKRGLLDTLRTLREAGCPYSGAGENLAEASAVRYFAVGGRKFSIVSASEIERFYHYTKMATEQSPGVLKTQQEEAVLAAIGEAQANSDYVIAYIHWGAEGTVNYDAGQTALAKAYVEAGADVIIGGHPHRLQGVTFMEDVPVVYGLGNFWFSTGTLYTTIAQLKIGADGGIELRMLPCIQKDLKTSMLTDPEEVKLFYHYLADVSSNVGIDEDGLFHAYKDVQQPGESPYAYTSGRRYGMHMDAADLEGRAIDVVGNLK